jgi:hypothetical protein
VFICLAVALVQAPLNMSVDFFFEVINSPTVTDLRTIKKQSSRGRLGSAMRRASEVLMNGMAVVGSRVSTLGSILNWFVPPDSDGKRNILVADNDVLNLPESVITSHSMVALNVGESHMRYSRAQRNPSTTALAQEQVNHMQVLAAMEAEGRVDGSDRLLSLTTKIKQQRRHFNSESRRYFDKCWG